MTHEEKIQKLYIEFQQLSNTIKKLQNQNEVLENQLLELISTNQSLDEMRKIKAGTELLVPLSTGIYLKTQLKESNDFIVNIGSGIALNKDLTTTKTIIEEQILEIRKMHENLSKELQSNVEKASLIEKEMKKIASAIKES